LKNTYDYIVIGAGSSGAVIASRLSENPNNQVLLIEAGDTFEKIEEIPDVIKKGMSTGADWTGNLAVGTEYDWKYNALSNSEFKNMAVPRGKLIGGTSSINGQVFIRAIPEDFENWKNRGLDNWSFEECLKHFIKLENDLDFKNEFHGNDGPIPIKRHKLDTLLKDQLTFYETVQEMGFPTTEDHNNPFSEGVGPLPLNNPNGIRWSTGICYVLPALYRDNFTVLSNSICKKIIIDNDIQIGVMLENDEIYEADEIIVSAGAVESPKLLLNSGIGDKEEINNYDYEHVHQLKGVGKNLRDHPAVELVWKSSEKLLDELTDVGAQKVALRYTSENSKDRLDMISVMRFQPGGISKDDLHFRSSDFGESRIAITTGLFLAKSSGELTLNTKDPYSQPVINYNYLSNDYDLQRLIEGVKFNFEIARNSNFDSFRGDLIEPIGQALEDEKILIKWIKSKVHTMHHISGTCKMGIESDDFAVVDKHAKVFGIKGLRVADCSIMPDCVRANTNATAIMIGEKISDHILDGD
jgi:choline dehydrogenase